MFNYNTQQSGNLSLLKSYSLFKSYNQLIEGDDEEKDKVQSKDENNKEENK